METNMADLWYYGNDGRKLGPVSGRELRELAACGRILPDDTIWREGIKKGGIGEKGQESIRAGPYRRTPSACRRAADKGAFLLATTSRDAILRGPDSAYPVGNVTPLAHRQT
jgi:hypothetical protein